MSTKLFSVFSRLFVMLYSASAAEFKIHFDQDNTQDYVTISAWTAGGGFEVNDASIVGKTTGDDATIGGLGVVWYDLYFKDTSNNYHSAGKGWYCSGSRTILYSDLLKYTSNFFEEFKPFDQAETSILFTVATLSPNDRCFCSNYPQGCTSCDYGCRCKPTAFNSMSNVTMVGAGARSLFGQVGVMTCSCSNHPDGCTSCDNGCECLSGLASGSGKVAAEKKAEEPLMTKEETVANNIGMATTVAALSPNDRCFCSNYPEGCTSCDYGCRCKPSAINSMSNATMVGAGARSLFGQVGVMTCSCSNHPEGCTSCDNGCECLSGLGSGSGKVAASKKVEEEPLKMAKEEAVANNTGMTTPVATLSPNDRCFCSNYPQGCTSCDYGCRCKPSAFNSMSNVTMVGAGAHTLFGRVGVMTCTCSNHPEGCTSCDNGCECLSGLGSGSSSSNGQDKYAVVI